MRYNPLDEISSPTGVKGIHKYLQRNDESTTVFSETKRMSCSCKTSRIHNDLVKHFKQDKKYGFINNGDKIRWVYLKNNPLGLKVVKKI